MKKLSIWIIQVIDQHVRISVVNYVSDIENFILNQYNVDIKDYAPFLQYEEKIVPSEYLIGRVRIRLS